MNIKGFSSLTTEEMKGITGGYTCPRSQSAFLKKFNSLSYNQQKAYIVYCYENNCSRYW